MRKHAMAASCEQHVPSHKTRSSNLWINSSSKEVGIECQQYRIAGILEGGSGRIIKRQPASCKGNSVLHGLTLTPNGDPVWSDHWTDNLIAGGGFVSQMRPRRDVDALGCAFGQLQNAPLANLSLRHGLLLAI